MFDGKIDLTKVSWKDASGRRFQSQIQEEHITLVGEPGNAYLGHIAPTEKDAKTISEEMWADFVERGLHFKLRVIGGDSTPLMTGYKGGIIHFLEVKIGHRLLICVCKLHTNELPLRHCIKSRGVPTLSNNKFGGKVGEMICGDVEKMPFDPNFKRISHDSAQVPPLPEEIVNDLSTDQKYGYKMVCLIAGGEVDTSLLTQKPGPVSHARWLTTANRAMRAHVSKHGLTGKDKKDLHLIVTHIVLFYYVMWFHIKVKPTMLAAPGHVFRELKIVRDILPKEIQEVAKKKVEDGAWFAHSEHLLLHLLSAEEEMRRFAVKKIFEIRGESEIGCRDVRPFKVPTLNWSAQRIQDMISWEGATEPIFTADLTRDQVRAFLDIPFSMKAFPCHTQSVERLVKEVSAASANVYGRDR